LVIDFGCVVDGYCSDITRAVTVAAPPAAEWQQIHRVLDAARQAAIDAIAPGVRASAVDGAARDVLAAAGLAKHFTHSLGHGVGLEVHEAPRLAARSEDCLESGMIVTIEPGIYLEGRGGMRLEDMVSVTDVGAERLNALSTAILRAGAGD
jgi:Xaa-Pro aminopeptidase